MPGNDPSLLVVPGGIPCQLQNLGSEVLHHSSQVDGGSGTDSLGIVAFSEESMETWKIECRVECKGAMK